MYFKIGEIVTGVVERFSGKGAIIRLSNGSPMFLAPKNLSWKLKNQDAADYFNTGDPILVKILSAKSSDQGHEKYTAGIRELYENPWINIRDSIHVGEISQAIVIQVIQIGLILRLPSGFDAFVHNTEVSWDKYDWKSALPKVGEIKDILIIDINEQKERISASIKQVKASPVVEIANKEHTDIVYSANVRSASPFGLFILLPNGATGLLHKSQIPDKLINFFCAGDSIEVRISSINMEEMKISLQLDIESYISHLNIKNTEILGAQKYLEGKKRITEINVYERNPRARTLCINHYGTECSVCRLKFSKRYGEIGEGFIHIHHLNMIADKGGEYELDPIKDMRPVCPNCHAMLHKRRPPFEIDELKKMINDANPKEDTKSG